MNLSSVFRLALKSIGGNKLRTGLTIAIITLGITALIGILTLLDGISGAVTDGFGAIGAKKFSIQANENIRGGRFGRKPKNPEITYNEAITLEKALEKVDVELAISIEASSRSKVKFNKTETAPTIRIVGANSTYFESESQTAEYGRLFTETEVSNGTNVAILGADMVEKLFPSAESAIGKVIQIGVGKVRIVGVLKKKGSGFGSNESFIIVPLTFARQKYNSSTYLLSGIVPDPKKMENYVASSTGVFRNIRGLSTMEEDNFIIKTNKAELEEQMKLFNVVLLIGSIIGFITLLGASVALMNILLVSVNERTREIGVNKALGAKASTIRAQFLSEAIIICQIGGITGIILGITIGNVIAMYMNFSFVLPIAWIILGFTVCLVVGLFSGWYPAYKASKLDPIEALRFE